MTSPERNKTVIIADYCDFRVLLHAFDNGDGVMYHQIHIEVYSSYGSSVELTLPLEASFDPEELAKELIKAQLNTPK
jgi:hypothetical protein